MTLHAPPGLSVNLADYRADYGGGVKPEALAAPVVLPTGRVTYGKHNDNFCNYYLVEVFHAAHR